ncbi:lipid II:glycine glycyltransferase FemX [Solicola gregarius]|uniref:Aminoacyltransferase n=1 Tax=Solicola gregarius TaxID=2908642 RepID=A0AA46TLW6_9ACTN|nr:peptidoglycan bridge formation glycyltransferase FemA/FemB family protein [Solicola gregarius]UYM07339.1 aminoacyltransferase [Solicola gregarius]
MTASLTVSTISADQHRAFIAGRSSASFLQMPSWGAVKTEWRSESVGWFTDNGAIAGVGLVLYRQLPRVRRYLAYLPEGPVIDWDGDDLSRWLDPMVEHLRGKGAFGVRMGPPVVTRRWGAATIKKAIADDALRTLDEVPADANDTAGLAVVDALASLGWREQATEGGFSAGQPKYNFHLPVGDRDEDAVLRGMNQLWRRNIKKATKSGVEVRLGGRDELADFHRIYAETAERDHFTPRPLAYFEKMYDALTDEDPQRMRLYLAEHEGDLVASTTLVQVGAHAWYSYGASTTEKREVRGSNAIQWQMIRDAMASGASVYDLRGITDTLDPSDPHVGLIQFKVGTGGEAVAYAGEWDLPISKVLYTAFDQYMKRRRS